MGKKEKWKRLMDAFGRKAAPEYEEKGYPQAGLREMAQTLSGTDARQWGKYAFHREPLEGKFTEEQKDAFTLRANACGKEWAKRIAGKYESRSPRKIAQKMGLKIRMDNTSRGGANVLFAQFVQPDEITLFADCIDRGCALREESGCALLERETLTDVLLAHELFHAVEERNAETIYTRTEKVELWRKPFSNRSSIACLSEIAAMAFAGRLLGLESSPYMLDVLLVYPYNKDMAWALYDEVCALVGK